MPLQWANSLDEMLSLSTDRVERHQQPVHLVGFSMGGYVACRLIEQIPMDQIASVILIGYAPQGLSKQEVTQRQLLIKTIDQGKYAGMTKSRLSVFVHKNHMLDPLVADEVVAMDKDLGGNVLRCHLSSTTPRPDVQPIVRAFARQGGKVHFIGAQDDRIAPASKLLDAAAQTQKASCKIFSNSAHMLPLEQPEALGAYLSHLMGR